VSDEFADFGLALTTKGGLAGESHARILNTCDADNRNDPDVGSPNNKCNPAGPGTVIEVEEGGPTGAGPNCESLGIVLIIQNEDPTITIPDDNVNVALFSSTLMARLSTLVILGFLTWLRRLDHGRVLGGQWRDERTLFRFRFWATIRIRFSRSTRPAT
jgi:hypothetical protein